MKYSFYWFHHGIWNKTTLASIWLTRKTQPILEVRREPGASSRGKYKGLVFMHWRRHEIAEDGRKHWYLNPLWAAWSPAWDPLDAQKSKLKSEVTSLYCVRAAVLEGPAEGAGLANSKASLKSPLNTLFYQFYCWCICPYMNPVSSVHIWVFCSSYQFLYICVFMLAKHFAAVCAWLLCKYLFYSCSLWLRHGHKRQTAIN